MHTHGDTDDIINVILFADAQAAKYTSSFAKKLRGNTTLQTAANIWNFLKTEITYKDDGFKVQNIKSPAQFYWDKTGDCKSYSVFTASVLQNLNIPYCYRFASYSSNHTPTHVYIIIPATATTTEIIIDAVWIAFNNQKPYTHKQDFKGMTKINYVAGPAPINTTTDTRLQLPPASQEWSDADIELAIILQRAQIMKSRIAGIGTTGAARAEKFEDAIEAIKDIQKHLSDEERIGIILQDIDNKQYNTSTHINQLLSEEKKYMQRIAIIKLRDAQQYARTRQAKLNAYEARIAAQQKRIATLTTEAATATTDQARTDINAEIAKRQQVLTTLLRIRDAVAVAGINGNVAVAGINGNVAVAGFLSDALKKASTAVKKVTKAVVKVATAPARLIAKGALEISLPKAAPAFLYLFVTDPALVAKLPANAKTKRTKQERKANFIVNTIGMKRNHFMGIVRNGILKRYGKQPEQIIAELLKVAKVSGHSIGIAPAILAAGSMLNSKDKEGKNQLLGFLNELIGIISKMFGKSDTESMSAADLPDESDWTSLADAQAFELAGNITAQAPSPTATADELETQADGGRGFCNW